MSKEPSFHQSFINSDEFFTYQESFGKKAFESYRLNLYEDWMEKTLPDGGAAVSLTNDKLIVIVRDKLYPYLAQMTDVFEIANAKADGGNLYSIENEKLLDDTVASYSEKVIEASKSAIDFIMRSVKQSRIKIPDNTPLDANSWQPLIVKWHEEMNHVYRVPELAKIISIYTDQKNQESYHLDEPIYHTYQDDPVLRLVCNELIYDFEYDKYQNRKISEIMEIASSELNDKMSLILPESEYRQDVMGLYDNDLTRKDVVDRYKSARPDLIWSLEGVDERDQIMRAVEIDFATSVTVDQLVFSDSRIKEIKSKAVVMDDIDTRLGDSQPNTLVNQMR